jgi:hypothetical protein
MAGRSGLTPLPGSTAGCGRPHVRWQDLGKHAAGTNVSRKRRRWDWRLEANLNRKANGLALEGPSVGLYVPLLEFNLLRAVL